ncbi:Transposon TX1 149 kDa protein [Salmo salar]|uniref:Transposon TX1 149 kDa protein n=1 Tax=Salmo salar TaxID=8030 RepID=B9EN07_SALSA|nr:Transposon TX1 149 kDa protein [Salmo salar]ACM08904.1 Transposon TX1 149 kDa protein [Salmo salar]|eukprot:NP_001139962.1 Transposon TX1 149 kDa protein [Salmo salar]
MWCGYFDKKNDVVQNVKEIYADNDGRLIVIEFEVQNVVFRLINVYASNIESERREMFHKLKTLCSENCILIGDFNVRCSRMDASSCAKFRYDSSRNALWKLMNEENLVDIWRAENPNRRVFSRRQKLQLKEFVILLPLLHT